MVEDIPASENSMRVGRASAHLKNDREKTMNIQKLLGAGLTALTLATASAGALAVTPSSYSVIYADPVVGTNFTDLTVGTIKITGLSDLTGNFFAATSLNVDSQPYSLSLQSVTFTNGVVGSLSDLDPSAVGFSFHNVAAGDYLVKASGVLNGPAVVPGLAVVGINYAVTPVPEPESYAMILAGLGLMSGIARRRASRRLA
jgi:hypothetical protein